MCDVTNRKPTSDRPHAPWQRRHERRLGRCSDGAIAHDGQIARGGSTSGLRTLRSGIKHRGGSARIAILSPDEKEAAIKAAHVLGLNIAGVDMLRSDRGPLILEVNSSPGLEGIELVTKKDIAKEIIRFVEKSI